MVLGGKATNGGQVVSYSNNNVARQYDRWDSDQHRRAAVAIEYALPAELDTLLDAT